MGTGSRFYRKQRACPFDVHATHAILGLIWGEVLADEAENNCGLPATLCREPASLCSEPASFCQEPASFFRGTPSEARQNKGWRVP